MASHSYSIPSAATLAEEYSRSLAHYPTRAVESAQICSSLNLEALKSVASRVVGNPCSGVHLVAEGEFNQIYILTFENSPDIIARINGSPDQRDERHTDDMISHRILSEVATLNFVRKNTSIPVPKVLAVDTDPHNPINARYTLQERILGHPLEDVWESLSSAQLQTIISQVARFEGELFQTRFSSIGSLLENPDGQFSVGHLGLSCLLPQSDLHVVGPWTSSLEWIKAYVEAEIDLLENKPDEWYSQRVDWCIPNGDAKCPVDALQLSSYFKKWYRLFLRGIEELPMNLDLSVFDPPVTPFVLFHEELSLSNILVAYDDPARVVGIVDWEGARVVPLWACFSGHDNLLPDYSIFYTELSALRRRRQAIQASMEPAVFGARDPPFPIQYLRYIASSCASTRCSVAGLNDDLQKFLAACSQEHGQSFLELYEYINSGKPVN